MTCSKGIKTLFLFMQMTILTFVGQNT